MVDACKTFAFGLDGECASHVQALVVGGWVVMLRIEGAYTSERLLEQGVVGVAWIGQAAGSGVLQQSHLHGLLGQGASLAVHGEAVVVLEAFHGVAGVGAEDAVGCQGLAVVAGVAEAGQVGLQDLHSMAMGALLEGGARLV